MDEKEPEIRFGVSEISLDELRGGKGESEDFYLVDEKGRFFALFDGLDNEKGSSFASKLARDTAEKIISQYEIPRTASNLVWMMAQIDEVLRNNFEAGGTSCVLARLFFDGLNTKLIFASIGDSRVYIRKGGQVFQATYDDAMRKKDLDSMNIVDPEQRKNILETKVRKYLNSGNAFEISYNNSGEIILHKGDRVLICSDGVTGETEEERLSVENIKTIFSREFNDQVTAEVFVKVARKMDDRTAIVASVW